MTDKSKSRRPAAVIRAVRSKITTFVKRNPGKSGQEIADGINLPVGAISRDLWCMVEMGRLRINDKRRYYDKDARESACLLAEVLTPKPPKDNTPARKVCLVDVKRSYDSPRSKRVSIGSSMGPNYTMYGGE